MNEFEFPLQGEPTRPPMASKIVGVKLKRGERIRLRTPGGGGYGKVSERPAAEIAEDLRLGYISPEAARDAYGFAGSDKETDA